VKGVKLKRYGVLVLSVLPYFEFFLVDMLLVAVDLNDCAGVLKRLRGVFGGREHPAKAGC
jgi:hypothetical protein